MYDTLAISPQAKHAGEGCGSWGVDGDKGVLADMKELGVWDPLTVKIQTYKTAIEVNCVCRVTVCAHHRLDCQKLQCLCA